MNSIELISQQRQKESRLLKVFLASSLMASLILHASAMTVTVGTFWNNLPAVAEEDEIEVMVTEDNPEEPSREELLTEEPPPEPDIPQEVALVSDLVPPPIPLAPASQASPTPGEDAPSKTSPSPTADPVTPLTNSVGDAPVAGQVSGPITSPNGTGNGFGNATQPTGYAPGGRPDGKPDGKPGGTLDGKPGGVPGQTAVRGTPPASQPARSRPTQPVCVSCPKPKFQGTEASPRVDLKIRPDGSVEVRLRKSSGNPDVDRATLKTMSQWRFDPQTVPQEGVRRRVRVTYEEEGSNFQRQNEERRRQEAENRREVERRRLAEDSQRQAEERNRAPATTMTETPTPPASSNTPTAEPETPVMPSPAPIEAPEPAPVEAPPPASEPAPVMEAPAPVEAPAPPPTETSPPP